MLIAAAAGLVVSQLLLKQGVRTAGPLSITNVQQFLEVIWHILTTPWLLGGYSLSAVTALLWLLLLSRLELSYAVPLLSGIYYVLALIAGFLVFQEVVSLSRWLGVFLIIAGIFLVARS
jgi:multidrug transporter EmrE-like cation transporter